MKKESYINKWTLNTVRPRQNGRHFADDSFKCISLNENVWIPLKISLTSALKGPINNIPSLVQVMAWRRPGDKPISEPMMVSLSTHTCVTRPQWVKECHWWDWRVHYLIYVAEQDMKCEIYGCSNQICASCQCAKWKSMHYDKRRFA